MKKTTTTTTTITTTMMMMMMMMISEDTYLNPRASLLQVTTDETSLCYIAEQRQQLKPRLQSRLSVPYQAYFAPLYRCHPRH